MMGPAHRNRLNTVDTGGRGALGPLTACGRRSNLLAAKIGSPLSGSC